MEAETPHFPQIGFLAAQLFKNFPSTKSDCVVPDPSSFAYGACVRVHPNGEITALNDAGEMLIEILRFDDLHVTEYRRRWLETLNALLQTGQHSVYVDWMRYPDDLPDLATKRVPHNHRPHGIAESAYERQKRGQLPTTF